ncbi:MAG TPA: ADOP family duplicated permease [Thermoanaerobaculia bacterium]|nr:ADOP family duplicated permease [Thermoanaerobaculia bacterium]
MLTDLRYAIASLRRRPLVSAAVILTLGLGIGANAAIFRAFNAAFLRPLPFEKADRLMRVVLASPDRSARLSPRVDVFVALRDHNRVFSSVVGQRYNDFTLLGDGEPTQVAGIQVSEGWARTLGVRPELGRTFANDEDGVALISDSLWRTRFGADPSVLRRTLNLNGRIHAITGVLPPGMRFPYEADVWVPARFQANAESTWALNIIGRLRDDITPAVAAKELATLGTRLEPVRAQHGMELFPILLRDTLLEDEGPIVIAVALASAFLLLLVTVNVANLLAAQSLSRQREFAMRHALGATFLRHLQQTVIEGLVLATAGGAVGAGVAALSTSLLSFLVPENFAYVFDAVPFDGRVLVYIAAIVLVSGIAFGAIPALRVARANPQQFLIGSRGTTEERSTKWRAAAFTIAQIAFAVMLLAAAHSVMRDVQQRLSRDLGFDERGLLIARIALPEQRYPDGESRDRFFDALLQSVETIPGVESAGTINLFPAPSGGALIARLEGEGMPYRPESPVLAHNRMIHGPLLEAMRVRLVAGRFLTADELRRGDAVAVISKSVADTFWPGENPIGKRVRNRRLDDAPWLRVTGVIADLDESYADTRRSLWTPVKLNTANASAAQAAIVVRSPVDLARSLSAAVHRVDPLLAVYEIATAEALYRSALRGRESARTLTGAFGLLGLVIAAIGVYVSMDFATARRTREIAVRLALGATPRTLLRQFLGNAALIIALGIGGGIAITVLGSRAAASLTSAFPLNRSSMILAAAVLFAVAIAASWLPLRRAMRLDPNTALRAE